MHIVQLSTADLAGGAERVALTLFGAYRQRGHRSSLVVGHARTSEEGVFELDHDAMRNRWARSWRTVGRALAPLDGRVRGAGRLRRTLQLTVGQPRRWWSIRSGREDFDFPATGQLLKLVDAPVDVLHAHNLHGGYFDLHALPALSRAYPFVLTLHDAWLLSGHCAHSFDCARWITGCGLCPDLSIYPSIPRDATAFNWRRKRDIYARSRLRIATPARSLMDKVERSVLAAGAVETRVIPNGLDTTVFRREDQSRAREKLALPEGTIIVMLSADALLGGREWKDVMLTRSVVEAMADKPIFFVAVGADAPEERYGRAVVRFVPPQQHTAMARYYQAADMYLHAARADTFPNVVLEALACATPVVATAVGGIPEQVLDGQTGLLVPPGNAHAFVAAVEALLQDDARRGSMAAAAAADAADRFPIARQVDAYLDWYGEILAEAAAPTRAAV